jgi:hypothetical protein
MAGVSEQYCMCSYGPECASQTLPSNLWKTCVSLYAHPALFNWKYYNEAQLKPKFGRDFTECEATMHWCSYGFSMGLNGTSHDNLRAYLSSFLLLSLNIFNDKSYVARTPALASDEFCWVWPTDCNWGYVAQHYFNEGYSKDTKRTM